MTNLTPRQKKILRFMHRYQQSNGYPPTLREIKVEVNIGSTNTVNYNLEQLAELGLVTRNRNVARGTVATKRGEAV